MQGFLTLDGSAARLGRRGARQGERRKENHTRKSNENAAEDVCLSRKPSLAFKSERAFGRYTGRVVKCNTGTVSKIKIEMNPRYC